MTAPVLERDFIREWRQLRAWFAGLVIVFTLSLFAVGVKSLQVEEWQRRVPKCPQDSVLLGKGSFNEGRWSHYMCGPSVNDVVIVTNAGG